MVNPLSEQLYWWNGVTLVLLRKIEVINEDDALLAHGGAIHSLPSPVKLGHNHIYV